MAENSARSVLIGLTEAVRAANDVGNAQALESALSAKALFQAASHR